jgi:hypothetical protein
VYAWWGPQAVVVLSIPGRDALRGQKGLVMELTLRREEVFKFVLFILVQNGLRVEVRRRAVVGRAVKSISLLLASASLCFTEHLQLGSTYSQRAEGR